MNIVVKNIEIPVEKGLDNVTLRQEAAKALDISETMMSRVSIRKKSLDARKKKSIKYVLQLDVDLEGSIPGIDSNPNVSEVKNGSKLIPHSGLNLSNKKIKQPPVIIGSGPAGIFAALVLAEAGQPAIIIERGEPVESRLKTVGAFRRKSLFNRESNYCYGEGGAGTFSDGKLTCGRNHPMIKYLFDRWVEFGAPQDILYESHPHIGTDNLLIISKKMRNYLESLGTEFMFSTKFEDFSASDRARYKVNLSGGIALHTDHLVLATGHSARDTYWMLYDSGVAIEPKPFAVGARFEHPQDLINKIQYGSCTLLPAAEYKLAAKSSGRGIWTFCMCPGGHLMPTNAQDEHLAINGMSYHARNSGFANAAVVVNVNREDFYRGHPLDGIRFQADIERKAFTAGGSNYFTPGQRLEDFIAGRTSKGELKSSYKPGVASARLDKILPQFIVESLRGALTEYNKKMHGFISTEAIVAGVESKTSAPVILPRNSGLQSTSHPGLFPCGEGAGYAGGIVSAGLDGVKIGRAVLEDAVSENFMARIN